MKKARYSISMSAAEHRLALEALLRFRNKALSQGIDTVDIDRLIARLQRRKAWWF